MPEKNHEEREERSDSRGKRDGRYNKDRRRQGKKPHHDKDDSFEGNNKRSSHDGGKQNKSSRGNKNWEHNKKDQNRDNSGKNAEGSKKQRPYYSKRRRTQKCALCGVWGNALTSRKSKLCTRLPCLPLL